MRILTIYAMICSVIPLFAGLPNARILLKVVIRETNRFFPCYAIVL